MNRSKAMSGSLILLGVVSLVAAFSPAADFQGTWVGSVETGMGVDELTLTLKKAGTGYAGILNDSLGLVDKDSAIAEVAVDQSVISFSFKAMQQTMEFSMRLTLDGDKLTGELQNKAQGAGVPFEFARKK